MKHESALTLASISVHLVRNRCLSLLALSMVLVTGTAQAQVTGISYSVSPSAEYVRFSDGSGLDGGVSFGGGVGFGFGEYLEVLGIVQFMPSLKTDWANLPDGYLRADLPDLDLRTQELRSVASRDVSARKYGGRLRLNIGDFRYKPYVVVGSGVLRMNPAGFDAASVIYGELGVGATFSIVDRFALSVGIHDLAYRFNPSSTLLAPDELTSLGLVSADFEQKRVRNLGVVASARFYLAGRADGNLTDLDRAMMSQFRGGNFRVAIEPTYGQVKFNSALGMDGSRALAGVNAGFDLGPYIGLRGFYLRDTKQDKILDGGLPKKFGKAAYYGGELQLRFAEQFSGGLLPYAILGGGFFDNNDDAGYVTNAGVPFESRYFAIVGGGIELPLGGAIRIHGAVRGLMMSAQDIADVSQASAVSTSPMYTVGLGFNIGGSGRTLGRTIDERFASEREQAELERMTTEARQSEIEARQARLENELTTLQTQLVMAMSETKADSATLADVVLRMSEPGDGPSGTDAGSKVATGNVKPVVSAEIPAEVADYISEERVVIPVPKVGEIYIRYGNVTDAGDAVMPPVVISTSGQALDYGYGGTGQGLTAAEMRNIVRQEIAVSQAAMRDSSRVQMGAVEKRFGTTLSSELKKLRSEIDRADSLRMVKQSRVDTAAVKSLVPDSSRVDSVASDTIAVNVKSNLTPGLASDNAVTTEGVSVLPVNSTPAQYLFGNEAVSDTTIDSVTFGTALRRITRPDSAAAAAAAAASAVAVDSVLVKSVGVDSLLIDSLRSSPIRLDSLRVDSLKVAPPLQKQ